MTKRLAISMLLTVCGILIVAGVTAYLTTRSVLVAKMDEGLVMRATPLAESGRFVVKTSPGQTLQRRSTPDTPAKPVVLRAAFARLGDGQRVRTLTVRTQTRNDDGEIEDRTVTLSEPADSFDRLMNWLAVALCVTGGAGGIIAAFVARAVARATLRPLHSTADTIGTIDEQNLGRRIDESKLASELQPVAQKLNDMLARLETSFSNRRQFLADASHELRTPVAALITTLEVSLRRMRDAESYRQTLEICLVDARLLRKLVDALMAQARSEIEAFNEAPVLTDVSALLHQIAAIFLASAAEKNISLTCVIDESISLTIAPGRLRQAVMGLLDNAIEHTPAGGRVELMAQSPVTFQAPADTFLAGLPEQPEVQIAIRDTGPGIDPEHLPRLFEPFYRVSRSRDVNGHLGLGLYLVRSHVQAMGGRCVVQSELGAGSTFTLVFPARKVLQSPIEPVVAK